MMGDDGQAMSEYFCFSAFSKMVIFHFLVVVGGLRPCLYKHAPCEVHASNFMRQARTGQAGRQKDVAPRHTYVCCTLGRSLAKFLRPPAVQAPTPAHLCGIFPKQLPVFFFEGTCLVGERGNRREIDPFGADWGDCEPFAQAPGSPFGSSPAQWPVTSSAAHRNCRKANRDGWHRRRGQLRQPRPGLVFCCC